MSSRLYAFAAFTLVCALPLFAAFTPAQDFRAATAEELAMTSVPTAPGAGAAILDWVRVDDDAGSYSAEYFRIKIFNEAGKKYADVEVPYLPTYPFNGRVAEISARTLEPDGKVVPFDGKVYDKVLYKAGRSALRAKTFSLANVQPGSILEYRYVRRWAQNLLIDTLWTVQRDVPLLHARLRLKPFDTKGEFTSFFTYIGLPAGVAPVKVTDHYELELRDVPAFQAESFAPPEEQLKPRVNFYYTRSRVLPEEFWRVESASWSRKIESFIGKPSAVAPVAKELGGATPAETAKRIYAHVQKLRNYSFETSRTDQEQAAQNITESRNAADVLAKGAGFRDEINRAFVALARARGLDADAIRVAPRDTFFFSDKLPDPDQMSGEIAVVTIDGQPLYLDPGTPGAPFGVLSWEKSGVPGFRVTKGAPVWMKVPSAPPAAAVLQRRADLRLEDGTLSGTATITFRGQEALVRRLRAPGDADETRKSIENEVKEWLAEGAAVTNLKITGMGPEDETLVAAFDVVLPNAVSEAGSRSVLPMSIFAASSKNPFAPATRTHPIYFPYSSSEEDEVKVTLPESLTVSVVPPPANLKAGAFGYTSETKANGREVTFRRTRFVDAMLIEAKYYGSVRNFYGAALAADQKPIVLAKKE